MILNRARAFPEGVSQPSRISAMTLATLATLAIGLFLTTIAWRDAATNVAEEDRARFHQEAVDILQVLQARMATYEQVLRGVKGLFLASDNVSRGEFRTFTEQLALDQHYPGILGIAFAVSIAPDQLDQHLATVRAEGFPHYQLSPQGARESYTAIIYIEPFSGNNLNAFGYDMYSESVRRQAMDMARYSGEATLSGKVSLVQDAGRGSVSGVLIYLPVYREEIIHSEVGSDEVLGWVYAPFSMDLLMQGIQLDESLLNFSVHDGISVAAEDLLYATPSLAKSANDVQFERTEQIEIGQRIWTVAFSADSSFIVAHENTEPFVVLFLGGLFTALMSLLVWSLSSDKERAEARAEAINRELAETEFRWESALSGAGHGVWDWNNITNEVAYNTEWKSMLGYAEDEIKNDFSEWRRLLHPFDLERAESAVTDFMSGKTRYFSLEHRLKTCDGRWRWILSRGAIISRTEDGMPARTIGTHTDIDLQKNLELALVESDQRFRGAFETAAVGMALVGLSGEFLEVNQSLLAMLGYSENELPAMTFQQITHPDDLSLDLEHLSALSAGKIKSYQMEKRYFCKDGSIIWARLSVSVVRNKDGNPLHYVSQVENITERVALQRQVLHQLNHDELTGLPNRRLLQDRLAQTLMSSRRHKRQFALMFIDIDHFKRVNDTYGHHIGDQLLTWVADRLMSSIRKSDTLARQGGDEFVSVLTEIDAREDAALVARKMLSSVKQGLDIGDARVQVSLSIGVSLYEIGSPDTIDDLLKKADIALYQVKQAGRNDFRVYQEEIEQSDG